MTRLFLALALAAQTNGGVESKSQSPANSAKTVAKKPGPEKGLASPARSRAGGNLGMSEEYKKELQEAVAKRRAGARRRALTYKQKTQVEAAVSRALAEWEAKVGPAIAAQQREQMRLRMLAQQTQAIQQMAEAAQMNAAANNARARLESQALGQSQIFVPGQGMIPYPYSIAQPIVPFVPTTILPVTPTNPGAATTQP